MTLAQNIIRFRKENELSQQQLAHQLNISRQSVSKWKNGESLPGIDNLLLLSGLLNISLDELITGEAYLSFPLHYGKPKRDKPIVLLSVLALIGVGVFSAFEDYHEIAQLTMSAIVEKCLVTLFLLLIMYVFLAYCTPFDFKRYCSYWTLEKKGIRYPVFRSKPIGKIGPFTEFILPFVACFGLRKTVFVPYQEITKMKLCFIPFKYNPTKTAISMNGYTPRMHQTMREPFYLEVMTRASEVIELDLRGYYRVTSNERKMLGTMLSFLKRKQFAFIDDQHIYAKVRKQENIIDSMYEKA